MSDGFVLQHSQSLLPGNTFIFDKTETNTDQTYDPKTGIFKVPFTGMYAFTWTLCVDSRMDENGQVGEFGSQLIIGGQISGSLHVDTEARADDDCSTGFVMKYITEGATVFLQTTNDHQGALLSNTNVTRSTFSG